MSCNICKRIFIPLKATLREIPTPKVMRGLVEERDLEKTIEYPPCGYSAVLKYSYQQLELLRPIQLCCFKIYCICVGIR